jgi:hypothetical protein
VSDFYLTITQSFAVVMDGGDAEGIERVARKMISRYATLSGFIEDGRRWRAVPFDPAIKVEALTEAKAKPLDVPQIEDKKPPRVDEELDIF